MTTLPKSESIDRDLGQRIIDELERLYFSWNSLTLLAGEIPDPKEARQIRQLLGKAISELSDIERIVVRAHPDLDPGKKVDMDE